jgi:hypothetical protein
MCLFFVAAPGLEPVPYFAVKLLGDGFAEGGGTLAFLFSFSFLFIRWCAFLASLLQISIHRLMALSLTNDPILSSFLLLFCIC